MDRPVVVEVAAAEGDALFWLTDQGFAATGGRIHDADRDFALYRKAFPTGWIGLGVNGLDRSSTSHYFATIRAADGSKPIVSDLTGASIDQASTLRPDRQDSTLFHGRAWKTRVPSAKSPDQVAIAVGEDASRSLAFTWRTSLESTVSSIKIAPATDGRADEGKVRIIEGSSIPVRSDGLVNDPVIRRHRVVVDGLSPDTPYVYALADGEPGRWAPWQFVRTAPAPSASNDLEFFSMGDPQCGLEEWGRLLRSAREKNPGASFLLIAGDLVDRGNERTNWDHFFLRAKGVFDGLPMMPAVGNHEYLDEGPRLFRSFFAIPKNGPVATSSIRSRPATRFSPCSTARPLHMIPLPRAARPNGSIGPLGNRLEPGNSWPFTIRFIPPTPADRSRRTSRTPGCR